MSTMKLEESQQKVIIEKIIENEFEISSDSKHMTVVIDNKRIVLNDTIVMELMGADIAYYKKIQIGMTAEEFFEKTNTFIGYKIFDECKYSNYIKGNLIEDSTRHGLYFTIKLDEVFRFVMVSGGEKFGCSLATISLKDENGVFVENVAIASGGDTLGTYRSRRFYIEGVQSLNDYKLIKKLYDAALPQYKNLVKGDGQGSIYQQAVQYFRENNCDETVEALEDLHNGVLK